MSEMNAEIFRRKDIIQQIFNEKYFKTEENANFRMKKNGKKI